MQSRVDSVDIVRRDLEPLLAAGFLCHGRRNIRGRFGFYRRTSDPQMRVVEARIVSESSRIGVLNADHWIGSMGAPPATTSTGLYSYVPSRTGLSTILSTVLSLGRQILTRRAPQSRYGCFVLRSSKEKRSMEPRQLRLPGFTFMCVRGLPLEPPPASRSSIDRQAGTCCRLRN